jgi:hypothetical protein
MPKVLVIVPRIYIIHNMRLWLLYRRYKDQMLLNGMGRVKYIVQYDSICIC